MAGSTEPSHHDRQRQALADMLARFTADRDSLIAAVQAARHALDTGETAFALVRPPGHHAERDRAMGFCLFNNIAVAAADAVARGLERVAVVDIDVHHGNGTQWTFYGDPRVFYISTHQYPFYPGTGAADETGTGAGTGFTLNIPLAAGVVGAALLPFWAAVGGIAALAADYTIVIEHADSTGIVKK